MQSMPMRLNSYYYFAVLENDSKASDVVKTIPFLKECLKTNNMKPFSFKSVTFLMFDLCRDN